MTPDTSSLYLDLLKRVLTRALFDQDEEPYEPPEQAPERPLWELLVEYSPPGLELVRRQPLDPAVRAEGRDRPGGADSAIGLRRLDHVQACVEQLLEQGVEGDLLEAGIRRGGASILMRAALNAHGDRGRRLWVVEVADEVDTAVMGRDLADVRRRLGRYGLLDEATRLIEVSAEQPDPGGDVGALALVRLDCTGYESTLALLRAFEPRVVEGGFLIVDGVGEHEEVRRAVEDHRAERSTAFEVHPVDWSAVYWRKGEDGSTDVAPQTSAALPVAGDDRPVEAPPVDRVFDVRIGGRPLSLDVYDEAAFPVISDLYRRAAWNRELFKDTSWLGVPIQQLPEDLVALQELVWKVRPDVLVETGVMHGGSVIFYASLFELLGRGRVVAVDVKLRAKTRARVEEHPCGHRVTLLEGGSTDTGILDRIRQSIDPGDSVLVLLDSDHSYQHVSEELEQYAELVTPGSYLVAADGIMEVLADAPKGEPAWGRDNPARAARDFLARHPEFVHDPHYERFGPTYCTHGFLRRREPTGH